MFNLFFQVGGFFKGNNIVKNINMTYSENVPINWDADGKDIKMNNVCIVHNTGFPISVLKDRRYYDCDFGPNRNIRHHNKVLFTQEEKRNVIIS